MLFRSACHIVARRSSSDIQDLEARQDSALVYYAVRFRARAADSNSLRINAVSTSQAN